MEGENVGTCPGRWGTLDSPAAALAREAPVHGRMAGVGGLLVATLDRGAESGREKGTGLAGIGAFDPETGEARWQVWGIPALGGVAGDAVYAYSRAGLVVALGTDGRERWRAQVPDDRSAKARARGDRDSPFVADVVHCGSSVALAAGAEVWWLGASDGRVLAHRAAGRGERPVISRIAPAGDGGLVATCTERTAWDEEESTLETWLWQPTPTLESLRTASGDVVAFGPDLAERWRLAPPVPGIVYGDRRPAATAEGGIVLVAARTASDGPRRYVSLSGDWIVALDAASGEVRWQRDMPGGRGHFDPVATSEGVVAGFEPVCYSLADGAVRWHIDAAGIGLDCRVAPLLDGGRLIFAGQGLFLATALATGDTRPLIRFAGDPFVGSLTTNLARLGSALYVGVRESRRATRLLAFRLPPEEPGRRTQSPAAPAGSAQRRRAQAARRGGG